MLRALTDGLADQPDSTRRPTVPDGTVLPRTCRLCGAEFTPLSKFANSATKCGACKNIRDDRTAKPRESLCVGCAVPIVQHGRGRTRLRCDNCLTAKALRERVARPSGRRGTIFCHRCACPLYDTTDISNVLSFCPDCGPGPGITRQTDCGACGKEFWWVHRGGRVLPGRKWLCPPCSEAQRWCSSCELIRPRDDFASCKDKRDGKVAHCRECQSQAYRDQAPDRKLAGLIRKYGISVAQYKEMLDRQGGACAICKVEKADAPRGYLMVDHDHSCCPADRSCGRCVRALLCQHCNFAIGLMKDSPARLIAASDYLVWHQSRGSNSISVD